jgi:hypothetical protein
MQKIKALHKYLAALNLLDENQIDSWAEQVRPIPDGGHITVGIEQMQGVRLGFIAYDALFTFENCAVDARTLFAQVLLWLGEFDPEREHYGLEDPVYDVLKIDDGHVDIELKIQFQEDLCLVLDAAGSVPYEGKHWRIATPEISWAQSIVQAGGA